MSAERDPIERLRAARPAVEPSPPPLEILRALIESAATDQRAANDQRDALGLRVAGTHRRWRGRAGALIALAGLVLAGSAWGANQLLSGGPVQPIFVQAEPTVGLGVPLRSSLRVLALRTPDPAGGPPWGMRIIRTSRDQVCLQPGRVVGDQVGAVGIGYAFHGDGRFHQFVAQDAFGLECEQPDAHGHVYDARSAVTVSADGLSLAENTFERVHCDLPEQHNWGVRCPRSDLRLLAFGLLGPDAVDLRVSSAGRSFDVTPSGPEGAYLLAFAAPIGTNAGNYFGAQAPDPPTLTVRFRNGSSCRVPGLNDSDQCIPEGLDYSAESPLSAAELAAPVHAAYERRLKGGSFPLTLTQPHSAAVAPEAIASYGRNPAAPPPPRVGPGLLIGFRARVSTPGTLSVYATELHRPVVRGCFGGGVLVANEPLQTLKAGAITHIAIDLEPGCHGRYSGRVFYLSLPPSTSPDGGELLLSAVSRRMMGLPLGSSRIQEIDVGHFAIDIPPLSSAKP